MVIMKMLQEIIIKIKVNLLFQIFKIVPIFKKKLNKNNKQLEKEEEELFVRSQLIIQLAIAITMIVKSILVIILKCIVNFY